MLEWLSALVDTSDFPARWHCGRWSALHGWVHVTADVATWAAYTAIPVLLALFVRRRPVPHPRVLWLFVAFIFACGTVHLVEATIFWWPAHRLSAVFKVITAIVSWATVAAMVKVTPRALGLAEREKRVVAFEKVLENVRLAVSAGPNAMLIVDSEGRIVFANPQVEALFGRAPESLAGERVETLVPEGLHAKPGTAREPNGTHRREVTGRRADSSELPLEVGLAPVATEDGTCVIASMVDITERKRRQLQLESYAGELERSNEDVRQLAAVASREVREAVGTVASALTRLSDSHERALDPEERGLVASALASSKSTEALIDHVVTWSRVRTAEMEPLNVDAGRVVREAWDLAEESAPGSDGSLHADGPLPSVRGSEALLTRLFQSLFENALEYRRSGVPARIRVSAERSGNWWTFSVSDEGTGIPSEHRERVFEMFEHLGRDGERCGRGVGLALCRRVVERHGGRIWVADASEHGTEFRLTLPAAEAPEGITEVHDDEPTVPLPALTLMVVEDDPGQVVLLKRALERAGHDRVVVRAVGDAESAWDELTGTGRALPDLLVLDLELPGMSGIELLRRLRNTQRFSMLPAVVHTTSSRPVDVMAAHEAGANAYFVKPADLKRGARVADAIARFWMLAQLPPTGTSKR